MAVERGKCLYLRENKLSMQYEFYKENDTDKVWWVDNSEVVGEHLFSFDKKKVFNLFSDYPWSLTDEERTIFCRENSYWRVFFADRTSSHPSRNA